MENVNWMKILTIGLCCLVATVSSCNVAMNYRDDKTIENMVKSGANPIDARCAIRAGNEYSCMLRASLSK